MSNLVKLIDFPPLGDDRGSLVALEAKADTIQKLIEAPKLRKQMGQAGRVLAEEVFTIEKIVQQHMNIYRELLES